MLQWFTMRNDLRQKVRFRVEKCLQIYEQVGLDAARRFHSENALHLLEQMRTLDGNWYHANVEYFIELDELLNVLPYLSSPGRNPRDVIAVIREFTNGASQHRNRRDAPC